jgi:hypothetical protein
MVFLDRARADFSSWRIHWTQPGDSHERQRDRDLLPRGGWNTQGLTCESGPTPCGV